MLLVGAKCQSLVVSGKLLIPARTHFVSAVVSKLKAPSSEFISWVSPRQRATLSNLSSSQLSQQPKHLRLQLFWQPRCAGCSADLLLQRLLTDIS